MSPRQRQGLVLLVLSVVGAVVTFASVLRYTDGVSRQLGPRQGVVVVGRDVPAYAAITEQDLQVRQVPVVFAPPAALASPADVGGRVSPVPLRAGTFLQAAMLVEPPAVRPGERAVTVLAGGEMSLGGSVSVGDVIDVIAAYPASNRDPVTARVEIGGARVLDVAGELTERAQGLWMTLAVAPDDALALARAQAAKATVVVVRRPVGEVP